MVRRYVAAALGEGIAAGDEDVARAALRTIDPVARGFAKRRLEGALIDAALACDAAQVTSPAPDHVMRVAALAVAGRDPGDVRDVDAVTAAYRPWGAARSRGSRSTPSSRHCRSPR